MKKVKGVTGIEYTTWEHKYGELESFMKTVNEYYPLTAR
jgi:hypothetical protein